MITENRKFRRSSLALAVAAAIGLAASANTQAFESTHDFSINDIQGAFTGSTYGAAGAVTDPTILCGLGGSPARTDVAPVVRTSRA